MPHSKLKCFKGFVINLLTRVAAMSDHNLMKASNIGVCFGPTLMRPERESVATIHDLKYQNIIIEVMVENVEEVCVCMCVCVCVCVCAHAYVYICA